MTKLNAKSIEQERKKETNKNDKID